jgi:predicted ATPase
MPYSIDNIKIRGFRRLLNLDLAMRPFTVLVGVNGVGKTSFLDAFSMLKASAAGRLNEAQSQWGGISNILTRGKAESLSYSLAMNVPEHDPLEYTLAIEPVPSGYAISEEVLSQKRGYPEPFKHIDSAYNRICYFDIDESRLGKIATENWIPNETSLSQVPKMFQQPEILRRKLSTAAQYHSLEVGPRAPVKLPQQMKPANNPGTNGEDLSPYLYYLRESDRDKFETITDTLRAAFPDFRGLNFPPTAAGMIMLTWNDDNFTKPLYIHELSDGIIRFLWLVSLLQSSDLQAVTMIDEPDTSMHPRLLSLLADLMREASEKTQLIVTTHSDRLVRFLEPKELVVFDLDEEGCTKATWADSMDIEKWLSDYSLDEVWMMGHLEGRS